MKRKLHNDHSSVSIFKADSDYDEACLDLGVIQQVDGANTTAYERPGRVEEVEEEAGVENGDDGWVLVEAQRKTRERGQVVQEEKKAEEERACRGGGDPIEALRKAWGEAINVVREDRTGSWFRKYPVLAKINRASNMAELMDECECGQERMDYLEKVVAGQQEAMERLMKENAAGGDVL